MNRRKKAILTVGGAILLLSIIFATWLLCPMAVDTDKRCHYIAHACGGIDGQPYTNSREALLASLENGFKFIEGDLGFTADSVLVLMHSEDEFRQMSDMPDSMELTRDVFCRQKIYGRYTPQTAADVLLLAKQHDFVLVTDKVSDPDLIERHFPSIRERTMVEAFSISDYKRLKRLGYTPMLSVGRHYSYRGLFTILSDNDIDWIETTVKGYADILFFRVIKRLLHVRVAVFMPEPQSFLKYVGGEIDLMYVDGLP